VNPIDQAVTGLVWYMVFLFSVTLHEAAHAWAAQRGGDPTAYLGGQVSLDPRPHIRREPFGMVILPLFTAITSGWPIGYASTPYDPVWALNHPRRAAWMSLAGPAANFASCSPRAPRSGPASASARSRSRVGRWSQRRRRVERRLRRRRGDAGIGVLHAELLLGLFT
jgi:hypothetical protein